jgi:hypothetical protein
VSTKIIEILVDTKGEATIQTKGFFGASCQQASGFIERALGQRTGERLTPEFYQTASVQEQQQAENG